jgi:hypothetical protein
MPRPRKGEPKKKFISRAISMIMHEEPGKTVDQAAGKAYGLWRQKIRGRRSSQDKRGR